MIDRRATAAGILSLGLLFGGPLLSSGAAAEPNENPLLEMLRERVARDPQHADSWRLIGRIHHRAGRLEPAREAFGRALEADPSSAAAHFDWGNFLSEMGRSEEAESHFRRVFELAPESGYATQLAERGVSFPTPPGPPGPPGAGGGPAGELAQASYEVREFDGSDEAERRFDALSPDRPTALRRLRAFVEYGALYNTNVTLTPISRELMGADAKSAQGFLNPDVEWVLLDRDGTRAGPLGRGYFSVNESHVSDFNLASFQPGAFLERDFAWGDSDVIGRVEYVYSLDLLAGSRFGDRHSLTTSATTIRPDGDILYAYWTLSYSNFDEDGASPEIDSLDGTANTLGISRFFQLPWERLPQATLGASVERADTEGADYRYDGVSLNSDLTIALAERWDLVPEASVGYRRYGDFTGPVARDELIWRVGGRLRWEWTSSLSVSAVAGYDRFASDNEDFDAERLQAGVVSTLIY